MFADKCLTFFDVLLSTGTTRGRNKVKVIHVNLLAVKNAALGVEEESIRVWCLLIRARSDARGVGGESCVC